MIFNDIFTVNKALQLDCFSISVETIRIVVRMEVDFYVD